MFLSTKTLAAAACALTLGLAGLLTAAPDQARSQEAEAQVEVTAEPTQEELDAAVVRTQRPSYPLSTCAVSGEALGSMGDVIEHVVDGRLVRLCCKGCVKGVTADPAAAIAAIDAAVIAEQTPIYPLEECVISGEALGSMGDPVDVIVGTRLVRVCCGGCVKRVKSDPAKYLAPIDAALIEAQRPTYGTATCFISDEPLEDEGAVEFLYGTRLVRLCCKGCKKQFDKDPVAAMAKLDELRASATVGETEPADSAGR